eukprot:1137047-Prymnesium_polylepis.1
MRNTGARRDCLGAGGCLMALGHPTRPRAQSPKAQRYPSVPIRSVPFQFRSVPRMAARAPHER